MKKIYLSEAKLEDAKFLLELWTDPEVTKFTLVRNVKSVEDCEERLGRHLSWKEKGAIGPFLILDGGEFAGYCGGNLLDAGNDYEIFYQLKKDKWGRGYGTQIVKLLLEIGFRENGADNIIARAAAGNAASWKILEKAGFNRVGTDKNGFDADGKKFDMYTYRIERQGWVRMKPRMRI